MKASLASILVHHYSQRDTTSTAYPDYNTMRPTRLPRPPVDYPISNVRKDPSYGRLCPRIDRLGGLDVWNMPTLYSERALAVYSVNRSWSSISWIDWSLCASPVPRILLVMVRFASRCSWSLQRSELEWVHQSPYSRGWPGPHVRARWTSNSGY